MLMIGIYCKGSENFLELRVWIENIQNNIVYFRGL